MKVNLTKIIDFITSKNIDEYYNLYRKTQWFDNEEIKEFQLVKFKNLVNHCYNNVQFFRDYMKKNNINPSDIKSVEDINLFPVITKEIIKGNYGKFIPSNLKSIKGIKTGQTGGTTGNVLFMRNDSNTRSSVWATFKRFYDWMDVKETDRSLLLLGGHVIGFNLKSKFKSIIYNILSNSKSISAYDTSESNINKIINELNRKNYTLIRSYSQFLYSLCRELKKTGLSFNVKTITTTAEPLLPEYRTLYKEVFNAEIFDQYGCGEIGGIAYECNHHKGLHVSEERVILEINEKNEIIVTDLDNYAMPFIRYWNADEIELSNEECSCGRKSRLIKKILGRTSDNLFGQNGKNLHWGYVFHLLWDTKIAAIRNLKKFQVVQIDFNNLLFRLVSDPLSEQEKQIISSNIREKLGDMNIEFVQEKNIENAASGKYVPVINNLMKKKY